MTKGRWRDFANRLCSYMMDLLTGASQLPRTSAVSLFLAHRIF